MKFTTLSFNHEEAVVLGNSDKAIIMEFVRWSCYFNESEAENEYMARKYLMDGHWWMQDSYEAWQERMPWLSLTTIKRYFNDLCKRGFLSKRTLNYGHGRLPNFYRPILKE